MKKVLEIILHIEDEETIEAYRDEPCEIVRADLCTGNLTDLASVISVRLINAELKETV